MELIDIVQKIDVGTIAAIAGMFWIFNNRLDKKFEKIEKTMDERFNKVDQRFEKVDQRFEKIEEKILDMDRRLCRIEGSLVSKDCCMLKDQGQIKKSA